MTSEGQKLVNENFLAQAGGKQEVLDPRCQKRQARVFVFFQQTQKQNSLKHNFYIFDIFHLDGDGSAKLSTSRLQYGTSFYPELDYEVGFKLRIFHDLINYR